MAREWMRRLVVVVWAAVLVLGSTATQGQDEFAALRDQVRSLHSQGRFADAVPVAEQYLALANQRYGDAHPEVGSAAAWLGTIYSAQARYTEAEVAFKRALHAYEKALGSNHLNVVASLKNLAAVYRAMGRTNEADALSRRALAVEKGGR